MYAVLVSPPFDFYAGGIRNPLIELRIWAQSNPSDGATLEWTPDQGCF